MELELTKDTDYLALALSIAFAKKIKLKDILSMRYCLAVEDYPDVRFFEEGCLDRMPLFDDVRKMVERIAETDKNSIIFVLIREDESEAFSFSKRDIAKIYIELCEK